MMKKNAPVVPKVQTNLVPRDNIHAALGHLTDHEERHTYGLSHLGDQQPRSAPLRKCPVSSIEARYDKN